MQLVREYLQDFTALFFPDLCTACGKNLFKHERVICTDCIYHLPYTNFHQDSENRVAKQLWGRFSFVQASAFVYFQKGNKVQNMMHQLKYNKRPETGFRLGELYAHDLKRTDQWQIPDLIIPVPLHPKKKIKRGYNQSEFIANGLSSVLEVPVSANTLIRASDTATQTKKSRFSRFENMQEAFSISHPELLIDKHILLVDDVITTGATLEACSLVLLKLQKIRISIATIAFAE
ncbi:ComF family protein [Daejeonella oryzae]|uniref:ComF family protein n=1 Tax=Daejeonella oryzae TaxID=1122943 RepID=UPI00041C3432|nr:ComF family protein [Daejeonella oryzae]